jgi:hypothetical protein
MFASACTNVAFWIPDLNVVEQQAKAQQEQHKATDPSAPVVSKWGGNQ